MTVYLIDGYNVLHELLGHTGVQDLEEERKRLIGRVADYMGSTSDRAIVVFDSHGQLLQKIESATANVEVYFGSFSRSADSIIEREAYAISAGENVVAVSSDYQLQKTVIRPNVVRCSSRQFVGDLQEHTKRIANSQNCITMSHRVEERIDPGTVERLKVLRDGLAARPEEPHRPGLGSEEWPATVEAGGVKDGERGGSQEGSKDSSA